MRDLFVAWCRDAGAAVTIDRMGNTHNEAENVAKEDAVPSVNVLLHAVLARANR